MQAIFTRYYHATNNHGARVKAYAAAGKITVPYDHALNMPGNHRAAAYAFAMKFGWDGAWVGGGDPENRGYAFVCIGAAMREGLVARVGITLTGANDAT